MIRQKEHHLKQIQYYNGKDTKYTASDAAFNHNTHEVNT